MKLKDYIAKILRESLDAEIHFEINLDENVEVVPHETGNKIRFHIFNEKEKELNENN